MEKDLDNGSNDLYCFWNQTLAGVVPASFVYSDFDMIAEGTG